MNNVSTFIYDTRGRFERALALCVVIVRTVNKPREIRAGVASESSQKFTQESKTVRILGIYIWTM